MNNFKVIKNLTQTIQRLHQITFITRYNQFKENFIFINTQHINEKNSSNSVVLLGLYFQ